MTNCKTLVASYKAMAEASGDTWHKQNALEAEWALEGECFDIEAVRNALVSLTEKLVALAKREL